MAASRFSRSVFCVLMAWIVFGSWALFRPDPDVPGMDPVVGHVVVFFFVSLATFGLLVGPLGRLRGFLVGSAALTAVAMVSEALQPILTDTRLAQLDDLGGNGVGILGALVVSGVLVAVLRKPRHLEVAAALICAGGLAASVIVTQVGADRIITLFDCRGEGLDRIDDVVGRPIIHMEQQVVSIGDEEPIALGDGLVAVDSADLRCSVLRSGSYTIVATVVPSTIHVGGPMRIFTSSAGTDFRDENTHLGQEFDELSIRVNSNGELQWELVPDVFVAGERVTVAMVVGDGKVDVVVDGEWRASFDLVGESFAEWDGQFPILIGDEFTRDRTFEGVIESVSVFDRILVEGDSELASNRD